MTAAVYNLWAMTLLSRGEKNSVLFATKQYGRTDSQQTCQAHYEYSHYKQT